MPDHIPPPEEFEGIHSFSEVVRRLSQSIGVVEQRISVARNSRASQWIAQLRALELRDPRDFMASMVPELQAGRWPDSHAAAFRALVDSRMFILIVEELAPLLTNADLHDLISGNYHPDLDAPGKRTRDREFEWFIAAVASRAKLPFTLAEPDIVVSATNSSWAVAAKRLRSEKQVESNVKKAANQIQAAKLPGYIFLDVTSLMDPAYRVVTYWRTADETVREYFRDCLADHGSSFVPQRNDYVRGVVLHAAFPHVSQGFRFGTQQVWRPMPVNGISASDVHAFFRLLAPGFENS